MYDCNRTITVTNPTSGVTYSFDNGMTFGSSATSSALAANATYQVEVKDNITGCVSSATPVTLNAQPLSPDFSLTKPTACPGTTESVVIGSLVNTDATTATVSIDGSTFGVYPGGGTISGLSVGMHTIALKNSNGCVTTKSVTINAVNPNNCIPILITKN